MAIKSFTLSNSNHVSEIQIKDSQQNLEEFTLMLAGNTDFSTFDVLSITRADELDNYTCSTVHRKVETQAVRVQSKSTTAKIIPWPNK